MPTIVRNRTWSFDATIYDTYVAEGDPANVPTNHTGWSIRSQIRTKVGNKLVANLNVTFPVPTAGTIAIRHQREFTRSLPVGDYWWDIVATDPQGNDHVYVEPEPISVKDHPTDPANATYDFVPGGGGVIFHTHLSTEISDSTSTGRAVLTASSATTARTALGITTSSGGNGAADSGKFVLFRSDGALRASSYSGQALYGSSDIGTGLYAETTAGLYHARFGSSSSADSAFIAKSNGAFGWFRPSGLFSYTARIQPAATLTASRTYTLPDATGTLLLDSALSTWTGSTNVTSLGTVTNFSTTGVRTAVRSTSTDTTLTDQDHTLLVNATAGPVNIQLPAASAHQGREYRIKKTDLLANLVTIYANGSDTIENQAALDTDIPGESITIQAFGTNWNIH